MSDGNKALVDALQDMAESHRRALDLLERTISDADDDEPAALRSLRRACDLVQCLRRLVPQCTVEQIHQAFGAPGDFGYETPVGDALARIYGVRS